MKNKIKVKCRLFDQSYVIDQVLAKKSLEQRGFAHVKLTPPVLFRGDTRTPQEIFKTGFYRRIQNDKVLMPEITEDRASTDCVSCTTDVFFAVGFADCPNYPSRKSDYSWVYMMYVAEGIALANDSLYNNDQCKINKAKLVNEVVVTGIEPKNIMAAFQIKTGEYNHISNYFNKYPIYDEVKAVTWKIKITDFIVNNNCVLKNDNPLFYEKMLEQFSENYKIGYINNPISPLRDNDPFPITPDMTPLQVQVYKMGYKMSLEDLKKITRQEQLIGIKLGFTIQDVGSPWFSQQHLFAAKRWISIDLLRNITEDEVIAREKEVRQQLLKK